MRSRYHVRYRTQLNLETFAVDHVSVELSLRISLALCVSQGRLCPWGAWCRTKPTCARILSIRPVLFHFSGLLSAAFCVFAATVISSINFYCTLHSFLISTLTRSLLLRSSDSGLVSTRTAFIRSPASGPHADQRSGESRIELRCVATIWSASQRMNLPSEGRCV